MIDTKMAHICLGVVTPKWFGRMICRDGLPQVYDIHVADIAIDYLKSCHDKKKHGNMLEIYPPMNFPFKCLLVGDL